MEQEEIKDTPIHNSLQDSDCHLIKPIDREVVHRICSGQVVLSLAIAMKELVENSIDAGATRIDIYLGEYGSEFLEVSDNGIGVLKKDFSALTLKHFTSKLREFNDLANVGTLGFRGEALSSLCALSDLIITTKHDTVDVATKITYDKNGTIINEVTTARENGMTVTLHKLFSTLPVRRKDFLKNLKREFNKMCQLLYAYCLVSRGIKFSCTNITNKGSKNSIVATGGHKTVRENIISIFGAKQISTLIDIEAVMPDTDIQNEYGISVDADDELPFNFECLISSVVHGSGRSTTDRQFYFINSRPCEPPKLTKLVNEIYKQFNVGQYPFVFLNVITKSSLVDVNVTPDKRQIFIENEKILLAITKASLLNIFKTFPSVFKMQNLNLSNAVTSERGIKRSISERTIKKGSILEKFKKRSKTEGSVSSLSQVGIVGTSEEAKEIEEEADRNLRVLIDIACKLLPEKRSENIVDTEIIKNKSYGDDVHLNICLDQPPRANHIKKSVVLNTTMNEIKKVLKTTNEEEDKENVKIRFRSVIKPDSNKSAEAELQKQIAKSDFGKMQIVGQFNLGFIITKLCNDLFIVDQHATDEKYNFEQLQISTVIDNQVLVNPKPLELTAGSEILLMENIEIFKKNGFAFKVDNSAPCTKKISLTALPVSKNCVFGKDDIDEMLLMLQNCPHGRPTMRHLINLDLIQNKGEN